MASGALSLRRNSLRTVCLRSFRGSTTFRRKRTLEKRTLACIRRERKTEEKAVSTNHRLIIMKSHTSKSSKNNRTQAISYSCQVRMQIIIS